MKLIVSSNRIPILLLALTLILFYLGWLAPRNLRVPMLTWDAFRDIITAQHLLAGGAWWADPVLKGYWFWYPPTHAAMMAALHWLTGVDLFRLYSLSPVLFNGLTPIALYLMACRLSNGNRWAALAAAFALAGMPWFVTYVLAFPTVMAHAVGPALIIVWLYWKMRESISYSNWILLGASLGALGLYHPPTFLILFLSILMDAILAWRKEPQRRRHWGVLFAIAWLVSLPYWLVQFAGPVRNPIPMEYVSPAMTHWEFVLPGVIGWPGVAIWAQSIPYLAIAAVGLIALWRRRHEAVPRWVLIFLPITLAGQSLGYARLWLGDWVPVLVAHEFQLYFQLTLALCIGVGIDAIYRWGWTARKTAMIALVALFAGYTAVLLWMAPQRCQAFCEPYLLREEWRRPVVALFEHTQVGDVLCSPDDHVAFFIPAVRSGRKSIVLFESHLNPRADYHARAAARDLIIHSGGIEEVALACKRYQVDFILASRRLMPPERIDFFLRHFETVFDDGNVYLFSVQPIWGRENRK